MADMTKRYTIYDNYSPVAFEQLGSLEQLCTVKPGLPNLHVNLHNFLAGDPNASYSAWMKNMPRKGKNTLETMGKSYTATRNNGQNYKPLETTG
jgi:hypothetical protein